MGRWGPETSWGFVEDGLVYTYHKTETMEPVGRILELKLAAGIFH